MNNISLAKYHISVKDIRRNIAPAKLYREALVVEPDSVISDMGALIAFSGEKTGRSPTDKRLIKDPASEMDVWWGPVNIPIERDVFETNLERATDYLNTRPCLYVIDGFAGWDPLSRLKIRVICSRPYHALFMHNMLIRPTESQLLDFGEPDFVIFNAGQFPANRHTRGMTSKTSVDICLESKQMVLLGTEYAGEMKKGVFTLMNYFGPKNGILTMHCSATADPKTGQSSLLFGLSGTGKTTLSADPTRQLIGDDEHGWDDRGVFNIEGAVTPRRSTFPENESRTFSRPFALGQFWKMWSTIPKRIMSILMMQPSPKIPVGPTPSSLFPTPGFRVWRGTLPM